MLTVQFELCCISFRGVTQELVNKMEAWSGSAKKQVATCANKYGIVWVFHGTSWVDL